MLNPIVVRAAQFIVVRHCFQATLWTVDCKATTSVPTSELFKTGCILAVRHELGLVSEQRIKTLLNKLRVSG